ncbi:MAG: biosynthetic-type acetolactate synthase large subunit, partial [Lachnospiraceae bacterium]|nr:biosynthetic-type acetolactate synthase large subunit [Lachnospiraceae bacterium]
MKITGSSLFVTAMKKEGVDTIFAYPGGYVLDLLDELYDHPGINLVLPRHEQGLIHAADGYARATGKVGVCLVTSGPGATNLVTGIANANYDSVPLVCFTGQVPANLISNDAFQEVDIVGITRNITKHSIMVRDRKDLARIIKESFYIARSGKPGPVVVDLPADVMRELGETSYPTEVNIRGYKPSQGVHMGQLKKALQLLNKARRPVFLIGGGVNIAGAQKELTELCEKINVPVVTSIMGRGAIGTNHPLYIGNIGMHGCYAGNRAVDECDLLFTIGCRFNDRVTGDVNQFAPNAKIVHIDIESAAISRNIKVDIPIVADAKEAILKIIKHTKTMDHSVWVNEIRNWNEKVPLDSRIKYGVNPQKIIEAVNQVFRDDDTIITTDVGQHQMWTTQYIDLDEKHKLITSGGLGTMGFGLPSAVGAALGCPDKMVVSISGDGGFQMNMQELATAVTQRLPMVVLVLNNNYLGMVRQMQELFKNKRYSLTCLRYHKECKGRCGTPGHECPPYTPDFVKIAAGYGISGFRVLEDEQIGAT